MVESSTLDSTGGRGHIHPCVHKPDTVESTPVRPNSVRCVTFDSFDVVPVLDAPVPPRFCVQPEKQKGARTAFWFRSSTVSARVRVLQGGILTCLLI
jgi:hypothetical protein